MLRSFHNHLLELTKNENGTFSEHVRRRWPVKSPGKHEEELREFILLLPGIMIRILSLWPRLPSFSKMRGLGSYFLAYMYHPQDFILEAEQKGLFAYLDDAYMAALFYELMIEEIEYSKLFPLKKKDMDFFKQLIGLRWKARAVIPDEAAKINYMLGELLEGEEKTFRELFAERIPS